MEYEFSRTELLLGKDAMDKLTHAHVAVFGCGGVGGYVIEGLVRAGIGELDVIDNDTVSITNINRQIIATHKSIGKNKTELIAARAKDINPNIKINTYNVFYMPETAKDFEFSKYDYVVDAIDTVTGKIELVMQAKSAGTRIISSMGTGNKLDATQFQIADISKTSVCPLARVMRRELKARGITHLKVLYSKEQPLTPAMSTEATSKRCVPGSISCVPPVAGLIIASEVIKDIINDTKNDEGTEN